MVDIDIIYGENDLSADEYRLLREDAGWKTLPDEQIKASLEASNYVVTARKNGEIVGMARCLTDSVYIAYVFDVVVSGKYRSCGIGKIIMERVINHFIEENRFLMQIVLLAVSSDVEEFYKKIGFKRYPSLLNGAGMGMWINGKPY